MNLKELRTFLKRENESSIFELARELKADRNDVETSLEILVSMNKVKKVDKELVEMGCSSKGCSGCSCSGSLMPSLTPEVTYRWIG